MRSQEFQKVECHPLELYPDWRWKILVDPVGRRVSSLHDEQNQGRLYSTEAYCHKTGTKGPRLLSKVGFATCSGMQDD